MTAQLPLFGAVARDKGIEQSVKHADAVHTNWSSQAYELFVSFLVVEKVPPYNATIYEFEQEDIARIRDTLAFTLSRIKKSQEQNLYPGYTDLAMNEYGIMTAKIPMWYRL